MSEEQDDGSPKQIGAGRPTKFNQSLGEKIAQLARDGKTIEQIAEIIGVSKRTLYNWQGNHSELMHAVKEARQVADELVEASLFSRAVGYSHPAVKIFCQDGVVTEVPYIEYYPPSEAAATFWLKNRQPEKWREKQPGEDDKTITHKGKIEIERVDIEDRIRQLRGEDEPGKTQS